VKFLPPEVLTAIVARTGAQSGDLIFFGAGAEKVVNDALGALRARVGTTAASRPRAGTRSGSSIFRCFEYDDTPKAWAARHHPFTAPQDGHEGPLHERAGRGHRKAYDVVLNGWEIGGGSVRIHRHAVQSRRCSLALGITPEDQRRKFGFLLDALQYGAPPHGGIAFGFDRMVAMMAVSSRSATFIAFPKTQRGQDLLVEAPSAATEQQLRELHIRVRAPEGAKDALDAAADCAKLPDDPRDGHPDPVGRIGVRAHCWRPRPRATGRRPRAMASRSCQPRRATCSPRINAGGPFRYERDGVVFGTGSTSCRRSGAATFANTRSQPRCQTRGARRSCAAPPHDAGRVLITPTTITGPFGRIRE